MKYTLGLQFLRLLALASMAFGAIPGRADPLTIVGTGDGLDILRAVADAYHKRNPGSSVVIPDSIGSGGAIAAVGSDRERMGRVARPLTANEIAAGIEVQPIFSIPSVFYVHPDIPVRALTSAQLRRIFAGDVLSWSEVGGPDVRIRVVRREDSDSSVAVFRNALPAFRDLKFTERSKLALTTQDAIGSVAGNPGAIGFGSYSTALAGTLGVIAIDGIAPTEVAYPAKVVLALIYKPARLDPDMRQFRAFLKTDDARRVIDGFGARLIE